jgi:MFS family permease
MGLFIAAFSIGRAFLAPLAGQLSDRFGARPFLLLGNVLLAVALLWLSGLGTGTADWALLSAMLLAGAGSAFFEPVVTSVIMGAVPQDRLGAASASVAMGRQVAFSVGVTVAGAIFTIRESAYAAQIAVEGAAEESAAPEAIVRGFGDTMLAGVAVAAIAAVLSLSLGERRKFTRHDT